MNNDASLIRVVIFLLIIGFVSLAVSFDFVLGFLRPFPRPPAPPIIEGEGRSYGDGRGSGCCDGGAGCGDGC